MRLAHLLTVLSVGTFSTLAMAHESSLGKNGGQVADDAGHHVEFTTKNGQVLLFLTDEADNPVASAKSSGRIIIQDGSKQSTVDLIAAEPNVLSAKLTGALSPGAKLVVSIKMGDGHDVKARFVAK